MAILSHSAKLLGGVLVPPLAGGRWRGMLCWLLHLLIVGAVLGGLGYVNRAFDLERVLHSPWPPLAKVWLPLLFLLAYILCWLGYGLYRLVGPERLPLSFPDADAAWQEALQALEQAGIDIASVPLYLVLGRPGSGEASLFRAGHLQLDVEVPERPSARLRIHANRDAAFITCTESSLLGQQARFCGEHADEAVMRDLQARLQHLCRLIVQKRRPYCPLNGIFVLVPLGATRGDAEANQIAELCHFDLQAVRAVLQVECPLAVLVCDLEKAHGFDEFVELFDDAQRLRSFGQHFPLVPDLEPDEVPRMFERGIEHLVQSRIVDAVHAVYRLDADSSGRASSALRKNGRLFRFQARIHESRKFLTRILQRGLILEEDAPPMIAGLYLAGTGADVRGQAFVAGIFEEMRHNQNLVSWTPQAFFADSAYRRMTRLGYLGLVVLLLLLLGATASFLAG